MREYRNIKIGDIFYSLEVLENLGYKQYSGRNETYYLCKCLKCGNKIEVRRNCLGRTKNNCGCERQNLNIIAIGTVFKRLKVIGIAELSTGKGVLYQCECQCKNKTQLKVHGGDLRHGIVISCGCLSRNRVVDPERMHSKNKSGVKGVCFIKGINKWSAYINYEKRRYYLGYYDNIEDAAKTRKRAEEEYFGNFLEWYAKEYPHRQKEKKGKIGYASRKNVI